MISLLLLRQIAQLFIALAMGWLLVRLGRAKPEDSKVLSIVSLYLINPCVIITAYQIECSPEMFRSMAFSFAVAIAIHAIMVLMTVFLRRPLHLSAVEQASIIYSNCVNLLIPVVGAILGKQMILFVSMYMIVQVTMLWSHCRMLLSGEKRISFRNIFGNLNVISMLVGLALLVFDIPLPSLLLGAMESVGSTLGPISMIIIGMLMAGVDLKKLVRIPGVWKVVFLRLIGFPLVILCLLKFTGLAGLIENGEGVLLISLLAACAPSGTMVTQLAQVYGGDEEYASAINVISTLLCIVSMPLMIALYQL
ncbi:AEC family transporter [Oscillibacter sp.]|uniref:AEC family transporter n=1 Tax=Oscillibacter sp. TaxID=1945593 RepID=UPI0026396FA3|nr:AEC family transporter [Oscillibacter sp.]MDD3346103.1 AEC family transporter [Oscillibacter sp.]